MTCGCGVHLPLLIGFSSLLSPVPPPAPWVLHQADSISHSITALLWEARLIDSGVIRNEEGAGARARSITFAASVWWCSLLPAAVTNRMTKSNLGKKGFIAQPLAAHHEGGPGQEPGRRGGGRGHGTVLLTAPHTGSVCFLASPKKQGYRCPGTAPPTVGWPAHIYH